MLFVNSILLILRKKKLLYTRRCVKGFIVCIVDSSILLKSKQFSWKQLTADWRKEGNEHLTIDARVAAPTSAKLHLFKDKNIHLKTGTHINVYAGEEVDYIGRGAVIPLE